MYSLHMLHVGEGLVLIVLAEVHCIGGPLGTLAWLASSPTGIIQSPMIWSTYPRNTNTNTNTSPSDAIYPGEPLSSSINQEDHQGTPRLTIVHNFLSARPSIWSCTRTKLCKQNIQLDLSMIHKSHNFNWLVHIFTVSSQSGQLSKAPCKTLKPLAQPEWVNYHPWWDSVFKSELHRKRDLCPCCPSHFESFGKFPKRSTRTSSNVLFFQRTI